jgi:hypothetical protein
MVYGGTKYKTELSKLKGYLGVFAELARSGRLIEVSTAEVDARAAELKLLEPHAAFNDEHLLAIVAVSRCRVVCTNDKRADEYLRRRDLYPSGVRRPKIYRQRNHDGLCCDDNIVAICRP